MRGCEVLLFFKFSCIVVRKNKIKMDFWKRKKYTRVGDIRRCDSFITVTDEGLHKELRFWVGKTVCKLNQTAMCSGVGKTLLVRARRRSHILVCAGGHYNGKFFTLCSRRLLRKIRSAERPCDGHLIDEHKAFFNSSHVTACARFPFQVNAIKRRRVTERLRHVSFSRFSVAVRPTYDDRETIMLLMDASFFFILLTSTDWIFFVDLAYIVQTKNVSLF